MKELRNNSVFAFFMINALFVLIVFLLQLNKDSLHVKWPFGVRTNITYDETTQEVTIPGHAFANLCLSVCILFPHPPRIELATHVMYRIGLPRT